MPRLPRLAKRLGLSLGSLVVAVAATELVVRATEPGPYSLFDRNPYVDSEVDDHVRHRPDFVGRWDGTWYVTDRRGFRGPEREPTFAEDELRVACVGDSCTFGKGVLEEACWPRQLEARLREGGRNAGVFNLGINGGRGKVYRALLDEHADDPAVPLEREVGPPARLDGPGEGAQDLDRRARDQLGRVDGQRARLLGAGGGVAVDGPGAGGDEGVGRDPGAHEGGDSDGCGEKLHGGAGQGRSMIS